MDFYKCSCNELVLIDGFSCQNCGSKSIEDKWAEKGSSIRKLRPGSAYEVFDNIVENTFGKMSKLRLVISTLLSLTNYFLIACLLILMFWPIFLEAYIVAVISLFFIPASLFAFALQAVRTFQRKELPEMELALDIRYLILGFSILLSSILGFYFDSINFIGIEAIFIIYSIPIFSFLLCQKLKFSPEIVISNNGIKIKGFQNLIKTTNVLLAYPVETGTDNVRTPTRYEIRIKLDYIPEENFKLEIRDDTFIIKPDRYHYSTKEILSKIEKSGFKIGKSISEKWSKNK